MGEGYDVLSFYAGVLTVAPLDARTAMIVCAEDIILKKCIVEIVIWKGESAFAGGSVYGIFDFITLRHERSMMFMQVSLLMKYLIRSAFASVKCSVPAAESDML